MSAERGPHADPSAVPTAIQPLFGGRGLTEWIREGGPLQRRVRAYSTRLRWHAYWFEHNWRTQELQLGRSAVAQDPVFIIGPWRSGTTALHELLAAGLPCLTPQTWQCFNPSTCFLTRPPAQERSIQRPMDQGRIATHSPQEDEFALLLLGEPSVYRALIDPRRLVACGRELWTAGHQPLERWMTFLRGIGQNAGGRRLLLKSPSHTFRLPALRAWFPGAKFVWIGRQPGDVLASNMRMWQAMTARYGLWDCPPDALQNFLLEMLNAWAGVLSVCLDTMPAERMLWVDFEELRTGSGALVERVLRFIESGTQADRRAGANETPAAAAFNEPQPDAAAQNVEKLMAAARQRFLTPRPPAHFFLSPPLLSVRGASPGGLRS